MAEILWRKFRGHPAKEYLTELLEVIGKDKEKKVIDEAVKTILKDKKLDSTDITFLLDVSKVDFRSS